MSIIDSLFHRDGDNKRDKHYDYLTEGLMNLDKNLEAKSDLNINAVVNCVSCKFFDDFFNKWFPKDNEKYKLKSYDICKSYMRHIISEGREGRKEFIESSKEWKPTEEIDNKTALNKMLGR